LQNEARQVSCRLFLAYLRDVEAAPFQPVDESLTAETSAVPVAVHPALLNELWASFAGANWGLDRDDFDRILLQVAMRHDFGSASGTIAGKQEQASFFQGLKLADLVLAKACAEGNERAWEHFVATYGRQLTRAAIAISGNETIGHDLADAFYAELYGLSTRDGKRRCPLDSYRGRGSLIGWLRTTLSQRFVDHYRRTYREQALDEQAHDVQASDGSLAPEPEIVSALTDAVRDALRDQPAEERFVLASYYLDGRTLAEIGKLLRAHEATISRRLKRATEAIRKRLLKHLEGSGMSRRAAEEALGTDPRDVNMKMDLKKLLQHSGPEAFLEKATPDTVVAQKTLAGELLSKASGCQQKRRRPTDEPLNPTRNAS
jgi:RNA polymerase sigma-70 factor, ECF subfamily